MTNVVRYRLNYSLSLDEQVEDLMLAWKTLGTLAAQRKVAVMMGIMMAMLLHIAWQNVDRGGTAALAAGGLTGLIIFATVSRRMRRAGRTILLKINGNDSPTDIVVELTDAEAIIRRPDDVASYRWSGIRTVSDDPEMIRLLTKRYSTINLPKRAFRSSHEEEECLAFIRQKLSLNGTLQS